MLLLTHEAVGPALVALAAHIFGAAAVERLGAVEVRANICPDTALAAALRWVSRPGCISVLVLTDARGSTPWRIANELVAHIGSTRARTVSGLNAPMLLAVVERYDTLSLNELAKRARTAGRRGIHGD